MSKHLRKSIKPRDEEGPSGWRLVLGVVYFLFLVAVAYGASHLIMGQVEIPDPIRVDWPEQIPEQVPSEFPPVVAQVVFGVASFFVLYVFISLILGFMGVGKEDHLDERGWWKD